MYKNKSITGSILRFILSIIIIALVVFLAIFFIKKGIASSKSKKEFNNNLNQMQETSKDYFDNKLPANVGDTTIITLDEMIKLGLSKELKMGNTTCSNTLSYISITKTGEETYEVKSHLLCGNKEDEKSETIVKKSNSELNCEECCAKCGCCNNCPIVVENKTCTDQKQYQFKKTTTTCEAGYTYNKTNKKCEKTTINYVAAIEKENTKTTTVDAKKASNKTNTVYTDLVKNTTNTTVYANLITNKNNTTVYTNLTKKTTNSTVYANLLTENKTSYEYTNKTGKVSYSYLPLVVNTNTTIKTTTKDATKSYTSWSNPIKTLDSQVKLNEATECKKYAPTKSADLCKLELTGTTEILGIYNYAYALYTRNVTYTCKEGYRSGTKCIIETPITTTTTSCPSGYNKTADGSQCVKANTENVCPSGYTDNGSNCKKAITVKNTYCASGYTKTADGTKCYKVNTTTTTSCPAGYTKTTDGTKCYKVNTTTTTSCPAGYSKTSDGTKCYKVNTTTTTSCPAGYSKTSDGTKCYKNITIEGSYYCENANAKLNGTKCTTTTVEKTLTCKDSSYKLDTAAKTCSKSELTTKNPISKTSYVWSTSKTKSGYTSTGKTKTVKVCK